jgi:hypothetical protein
MFTRAANDDGNNESSFGGQNSVAHFLLKNIKNLHIHIFHVVIV